MVNIKAIKKFYNDNGYIILRDFISKKHLKELKLGIIKNAFKIISYKDINVDLLSNIKFQ